MIASVSGVVLRKGLDHVVVEAAGVGYLLSASSATIESVPAVGGRATLHTELVVREDSMQLFGFATVEEHDLFKLLTSVNGVGPKVALSVLGVMSVPEAETALAGGDHAKFQKVPGIGKRTAERLVVELKDKVMPSGAPTVSRAAAPSDPVLLARDALIGLGYSLDESESLLAGAQGETAEELISAALRGAAA